MDNFFNNLFHQKIKHNTIDLIYQKYNSNVTKSIDKYEKNLNDIMGLKIPETCWGADIHMIIKIKNKSYISTISEYFVKCHIECTRSHSNNNNNWNINITSNKHSFVYFSITKDGQIQYSSEDDFEIKYYIIYF